MSDQAAKLRDLESPIRRARGIAIALRAAQGDESGQLDVDGAHEALCIELDAIRDLFNAIATAGAEARRRQAGADDVSGQSEARQRQLREHQAAQSRARQRGHEEEL